MTPVAYQGVRGHGDEKVGRCLETRLNFALAAGRIDYAEPSGSSPVEPRGRRYGCRKYGSACQDAG